MKINNQKIFWSIVIIILIIAAGIASKLTGYDIDNPDGSKEFTTTVLFVIIFVVILFVLWMFPIKKK